MKNCMYLSQITLEMVQFYLCLYYKSTLILYEMLDWDEEDVCPQNLDHLLICGLLIWQRLWIVYCILKLTCQLQKHFHLIGKFWKHKLLL